jgi:hypothetical protein
MLMPDRVSPVLQGLSINVEALPFSQTVAAAINDFTQGEASFLAWRVLWASLGEVLLLCWGLRAASLRQPCLASVML